MTTSKALVIIMAMAIAMLPKIITIAMLPKIITTVILPKIRIIAIIVYILTPVTIHMAIPIPPMDLHHRLIINHL